MLHRLSPQRRPRDEEGITLVEMLVSLFVFALFTTALVAVLANGLGITRNNKARDVATSMASRELDVARNTDINDFQLGQLTRPLVGEEPAYTVDGIPYTVVRSAQWVSQGSTAGACDGGAGVRQAYLRVSVKVTWPRSGKKAVTSDTLITPPVGAFNSASGSLAVTVRDRDGLPESGTPVYISGPSVNKSQTTSTDGCAFFAYLPGGSYTVSASRSAFVSPGGAAIPTGTASVSIGNVSSYAFDYDQAGTVSGPLGGPTGYAVPSGLPVRFGSSNAVFPYGVTQAYPTTGTSLVNAGPLYPFASNYTVWAGDCADAKPSAPQTVLVERGKTTTLTKLTLGGVTITAPTAGQALYAHHLAETVNGGCSGLTRTYSLGSTNAAKQLAVALPYGKWIITKTATSPPAGTTANLTLTQGVAAGTLVVS